MQNENRGNTASNQTKSRFSQFSGQRKCHFIVSGHELKEPLNLLDVVNATGFILCLPLYLSRDWLGESTDGFEQAAHLPYPAVT